MVAWQFVYSGFLLTSIIENVSPLVYLSMYLLVCVKFQDCIKEYLQCVIEQRVSNNTEITELKTALWALVGSTWTDLIDKIGHWYGCISLCHLVIW